MFIITVESLEEVNIGLHLQFLLGLPLGNFENLLRLEVLDVLRHGIQVFFVAILFLSQESFITLILIVGCDAGLVFEFTFEPRFLLGDGLALATLLLEELSIVLIVARTFSSLLGTLEDVLSNQVLIGHLL